MRGLRVVIPLLLLFALGCALGKEKRYQSTLDGATLAIRRGDLSAAQALADEGVSLTRSKPDSEWAWRFTLLRSEVLLRKHELPEGRRLLSANPPDGAAFDLVRARRQFLVAFDRLVDGDREAASAAMAQARSLTPASPLADDLRFDIDGIDGAIDLIRGHRAESQTRLTGMLQAAKFKGDRYHQALALQNLGYGQLLQKRYDAALTWLEQVLALKDLSDLTVYADALNNAGICYARLGLFDRAMAAQREAVERDRGGARRQYEQALGQLGTTYLDAGRDREGIEHLRKALDVASDAGLSADAALWAGNLAAAHVKSGDLEAAERFNDEAKRFKTVAGSGTVYNKLRAADIAERRGQLTDASRLFDEALAASPGDPSVIWSAHEGLAEVAIAARRPTEAMRHFATALDTVEKTRSELMRTDYRLSYLTRLIEFYRAYVDLLVDGGQIERALEIADSSRGRVLAERQGVDAASPGMNAGALRARAAESGTVFLSYWLAPLRSYVWLVTPARVQVFTLPPAREIDALVRQHQAAIDNVLVDPLKSPDTAGGRLFQILVQPALPSIPRGSRLLIVPDAALYALNFETLPVGSRRPAVEPRAPSAEAPGFSPERAERHYLIEDFEIAVAPSLAMLTAHTAPAPSAMKSLLLIGNATPRAPDYPGLKFASAEMTNVARHFPEEHVSSYQGERAIPAAYREARPDRFSHVHFTAHATANLDSPLDSAVILSGPDGAFKLYARDVAELPLHAELVTVSACRSAGGRTYSGEGLVGFAWAFLRGGAKRVIAGLWDVDDRSTAELMDGLYGGLAAGEPAGRALRAAKLSQLRRGGAAAGPYYWAPFELFTLTP